MTMTQLNTRIDAATKERGDAVLAQAGYSSSQAVRVLWEFAAKHAHDPHAVKRFLQQAEGDQKLSQKSVIDEKLEALERCLTLHDQLEAAVGSHQSAEPTASDRTLRGEALLSRWEERGLL